ncbi:MAG: hypothetical protein A2Z30_08690 [Chloroflexi bacterium RBG_16_64_43]|nr:MAG: hypothetical protein A2Z30_08690 [Chloroflexi bacterium RBG_16_64_43]
MPTSQPPARSNHDRLLVLLAWSVMLLVSDLPNMLLRYTISEPVWLSLSKTALLIGFLTVSLAFARLRPLWKYGLVFAVFYLAKSASQWVAQSIVWQAWFGGHQASFWVGWLGALLPDAGMTVIMVLVTWAVMRRREAALLVLGRWNATLEPVRWLGIRQAESWKVFGWIFSGCIVLGVGVFVVASAGPALGNAPRILPLLPAVVLFAAMNSLEEELSYRAPLLATSHEVIGRGPSLWLTAVFFGLAHALYGTPAGIVGFVYTGLVAYLFGKSMLETHGSGWAFVMHTIADIPIFLLYALKSV